MRVLKYVFAPSETELKLELPIESEVLHVGLQEDCCIYKNCNQNMRLGTCGRQYRS